MSFYLRPTRYLSRKVPLSKLNLPVRSFFSFDGGRSNNDGDKLPAAASGGDKKISVEYLSRQDIVEMIAEDHDLTKAKADRVVRSIFDTIGEAVTERKIVKISGFGSFENKHYKSRLGTNPQTGEAWTVNAQQRVKFKAYKALKASVNGK